MFDNVFDYLRLNVNDNVFDNVSVECECLIKWLNVYV